MDNGRHLFTGWATLPHRGTWHWTGWVSRVRSERTLGAGTQCAGTKWVGRVRSERTLGAWSGWVHGALDDVVEGAGVVDHAGSLA